MFKITENNNTKYYKDEECTILHREDGPAIEYSDGEKHWYLNGKPHREDGPAIECSNGNKYWALNGLRHREDGPAVEFANGYRFFYLNDMKYYGVESNEHWVMLVKTLILL